MFRLDAAASVLAGFVARKENHAAGFFRVTFKHRFISQQQHFAGAARFWRNSLEGGCSSEHTTSKTARVPCRRPILRAQGGVGYCRGYHRGRRTEGKKCMELVRELRLPPPPIAVFI